MARLNVNIDHVATVRQARRAPEPSLVAAAMVCEAAGADGITIHLRSDRRHVQDIDLRLLRDAVTTYLNVEMAVTDEMLQIALDTKPDAVTLVPETPNEVTTEGGLDVAANEAAVGAHIEPSVSMSNCFTLRIAPDFVCTNKPCVGITAKAAKSRLCATGLGCYPRFNRFAVTWTPDATTKRFVSQILSLTKANRTISSSPMIATLRRRCSIRSRIFNPQNNGKWMIDSG